MVGNGREKLQWTFSKHDKGLSVLEQYGLISEVTYRGRGTLLCQTSEGLKMIKPYTGSGKRLEKINQLLEHLKAAGHENVDLVLRNQEGNLISTDKDGFTYLVKNWWDVRECDTRSESDVLRCMEQMAYRHKNMFLRLEGECEEEHLLEEYEKHNQEMRKIRTYIRHRKQKSVFEYRYLEHVQWYLDMASSAVERLKGIGYEMLRRQDLEKGSICHGMCNQHNFLLAGDKVTLVNYDHFFYGNHTADVAQFLRKIMEKHNWNVFLGKKMLDTYNRICPMTDAEWKLLAIRMSYPEKYWKISNFYYNNNKAFLPEKTVEKLNVVLSQNHRWMNFLETIFEVEK